MELYRQEERAHEDAALNLFASMFLPLEAEGITVSIGDSIPVKPKVNPWKIVRKQSKIIKKQEKELKGYRDMIAFPAHTVIPFSTKDWKIVVGETDTHYIN